jgi:hypothetical protein
VSTDVDARDETPAGAHQRAQHIGFRDAAGGPTRHNQRQTCGTVLKDNEIECDRIIAVAKGGSSEKHNVRVACFDYNSSTQWFPVFQIAGADAPCLTSA